MLGWLVSQVVMSIVGSVVVVQMFKIIFRDILGPATDAVKTSLFVGVGTAITTALGMRSFKKGVDGLRQVNKEVEKRIAPLPTAKRIK